MSTTYVQTYHTESGSAYEVTGRMIRKRGGDGAGPVDQWRPFRALNRIPASLLAPGEQGEILEILLESGRRILTSRLLPVPQAA